MAYPRFQRARAHKFVKRVTTSITINSTTWTALHASEFDIALEAQTGDVVEVGMTFLLGASSSITTVFDVLSIVSAAPVNSWATDLAYASAAGTNDGIPGLRCEANSTGMNHTKSAATMRTITAGDISGGLVTLRPYYIQLAGAANQTFYGTSRYPSLFWAKNLGPMDPN